MSGILKRTIFVHQDKDKVLFHDWAKVVTSLGTMVEPKCLMAQRPFDGVAVNASKMDYTDDINRIDLMETVHIGKESMILCDEQGTIRLHSGIAWPRVGF